MRKVSLGLVGLGNQGPRYARLVTELPQADLIATCSRSEERAREIADLHGATRSYTDYRTMVEEPALDGVIIVTEVDRHVEIVVTALEAGKHVLVEKPLTAGPDLEETDRVLDLAERQGCILMLAWVERYDARCSRVKRAIDEERLGKIVSIFIRRNGWRRYFRKPRFQQHPWIWEPGVHSLDLLLWLAGERPLEVYACGGKMAETGLEDTFWVMTRFESGAVGVIEQVANTIPETVAPTGDREVEVIGTEGTIRWFEPNDSFVLWRDEAAAYLDTHWYSDVAGLSQGALKNQVATFVRCLREERQPEWGTPDEIRLVARLGKAILESLESRRTVRLGDL